MDKKTKPKFSNKLYIVFWATIAFAFLFFTAIQAEKYFSNLKSIALLEMQIEAESRRKADLSRDFEYFRSDSFVERVAREQLGFIKSNEIIFYELE